MSASIEVEAETPPKSRKKTLILGVATLLAAGLGFAGTYLGLVPALPFIGGGKEAPVNENPFKDISFVDVPAVMVTIPGSPPRQVVLAAKLEVDSVNAEAVQYMQPRIADLLNTFLSGIDPQAFDRRGILEIIRAEIATRVDMVLGPGMVRDVLITQFGIK